MIRAPGALLALALFWTFPQATPKDLKSGQSAAPQSAGGVPQAAPEILKRASQQFRARDFEDAARLYKQALAGDAASGAAHAGLILSYLRQDDLSDAEAAAQAALKSAAASAGVHAAVGDLDYREGRFDEAEQEYHRALDLNGKLPGAWFGLGRLASISCNHATAQFLFQRARQLARSNPESAAMPRRPAGLVRRPPEAAVAGPSIGNSTRRENTGSGPSGTVFRETAAETLASPYEHEVLRLFPLLFDPQRIRGWGLRVSLNGAKPVNLLLDSGSTGITISSRAAKKAGITGISDAEIGGVGAGKVIPATRGVAGRVEIGKVEFENVPVTISDRKSVADQDGLIGVSMFARWLIGLDMSSKARVILDPLPQPPGTNPPGPHDRYLPPEMRDFSAVYIIGGMLMMPAKINDSIPTLFMIDTGTSRNLISTDSAREFTKVQRDQFQRINGVQGQVKDVFAANEVTITFAHFRQKNPGMTALDLEPLSKRLGTEVSGIFGWPMLSAFEVQIDYRDGLVKFDYQGPR